MEGGMGWRVGCEGWEEIEQSPHLSIYSAYWSDSKHIPES